MRGYTSRYACTVSKTTPIRPGMRGYTLDMRAHSFETDIRRPYAVAITLAPNDCFFKFHMRPAMRLSTVPYRITLVFNQTSFLTLLCGRIAILFGVRPYDVLSSECLEVSMVTSVRWY